MCFLESLRIEAPVTLSMSMIFTKDSELLEGKYKIKKDTQFHILTANIHHNKKYWIEPEKFIPERFDATSSYYLQPNGKKRHPLAFSPFSGGRRICTGKTFAEIVAKYVISGLIGRYEFELIDKKYA